MRKSHKKSHLGCQTCKKRKIKCDEVKPSCGKCVRFGVPCDFSPISLQPNHGTTRSGLGGRGRPRSDWASWAEQIRLASTGSASGGCQSSSHPLNVGDIELFHKYMTNTVTTLGNDHALWREGAPRLGFQHPCILDLMLALSAYHLARLSPLDSTRYLRLAEQHSTAALQAAAVLLNSLIPETSPALYIVSVLICFVSLAKGPSPGNLLLVAEDGQVPWLSLLWGVRLIVNTTGWSAIFSGTLAEYFPKPSEDKHDEPVQSLSTIHCPEDWRSSLNDVSSLTALIAEPRFRDAYQRELEILTGCCETTFGRGQQYHSGVIGKMEIVLSWIYQLDDTYVEGLSKKDPVSLIILGHFCVLLHTLEHYWFIEDWAVHIMTEILRSSEATKRWLSWPIASLGVPLPTAPDIM
ncbi:hypothetical protein BKA56DRAFT_638555 [Ilyonectria sp. MPI-CAGE-AT-0026]|nr:hypothetical protein BKA56DRAFT_638555 [Ilyonectria sp. MPI-CAGE-AT-0026]